MLEFKKDFNDNWKIVDESGLISINVRPDKVKVFHTRMDEFDEFENPVGHLNPSEAFGPGSPLRDPLS